MRSTLTNLPNLPILIQISSGPHHHVTDECADETKSLKFLQMTECSFVNTVHVGNINLYIINNAEISAKKKIGGHTLRRI